MIDERRIIELALKEDIGFGDITTDFLNLENKKSTAFITAKAKGVLAGLEIAMLVFNYLDPDFNFVSYKKDGDRLNPGDDIVKVEGKTSALLTGERTALNFLQKLSGIASLTAEMADMIKPYGVKLLDTRKTTPLLREFEKYAVRLGGGHNHRFGLYDMILLKDNHIKATGSIKKAVDKIKQKNINYKIEVEVKNLTELEEAVTCKVDRILLDNMDITNIQRSAALVENMCPDKENKRIELEISGGITLENIEKYAQTGVDFISSGAVIHSAKALDITMLFRE